MGTVLLAILQFIACREMLSSEDALCRNVQQLFNTFHQNQRVREIILFKNCNRRENTSVYFA